MKTTLLAVVIAMLSFSFARADDASSNNLAATNTTNEANNPLTPKITINFRTITRRRSTDRSIPTPTACCCEV
jgi:hypothetical protein